MKTTSEKFGDEIEQVLRRAKHRPSAEPLKLSPEANPPSWTIAISRECGAGGSEISRMLGSRLDWPVYDRELVEKIANNAGVRAELLTSLDEKFRSSLAEWIESLVAGKTITNLEFSRQLTSALSALSAHGQCIIVGRGAAVALASPTTLRVRLVAPLEVRIARERAKYSLSEHEAARRIRETDEGRYEFVRAHFSKDIRDGHLHDLILNTARLSVAQCTDTILAALPA